MNPMPTKQKGCQCRCCDPTQEFSDKVGEVCQGIFLKISKYFTEAGKNRRIRE
jgi:hypothetical protein